MQNNNLSRLPKVQITLLAIGLVAVMIAGAIYSQRSKTYEPTKAAATSTSYGFEVTNAQTLHNWVPDSLYNFTMARLQDYINNNNLNVDKITLDTISIANAQYVFNANLQPQDDDISVAITPIDYGDALTASVTVNGQVVGISASKQVQDTSYSGLDDLINIGVSSFQIKGLQQSIQKFRDVASVDISNINDGNATSDGKATTTFDLRLNDTTYKAKFIYSDITVSHLYIYDQSNKQVFDSGDIDVES